MSAKTFLPCLFGLNIFEVVDVAERVDEVALEIVCVEVAGILVVSSLKLELDSFSDVVVFVFEAFFLEVDV